MSVPQCSQGIGVFGIGVRLDMALALGCVTGMLKEPQADLIGGDRVLCLSRVRGIGIDASLPCLFTGMAEGN